ncbi:MAG: helix-turn-helix transcriptional regulator [Bacteroidetes bacterium]|nr:helix-turn-helix transcriptional regulator [Bacteroidota bacterium]
MVINNILKVKILESYQTQKDFAKKVGLSENLLSRFINDREIPTVHMADQIANGLGLKTFDIFLQVIKEGKVVDVIN